LFPFEPPSSYRKERVSKETEETGLSTEGGEEKRGLTNTFSFFFQSKEKRKPVLKEKRKIFYILSATLKVRRRRDGGSKENKSKVFKWSV